MRVRFHSPPHRQHKRRLNLLSDAAVRSLFDLVGWRGSSAMNPHQDHGFQQGVLGCALSHHRAWRSIAENPELAVCVFISFVVELPSVFNSIQLTA